MDGSVINWSDCWNHALAGGAHDPSRARAWDAARVTHPLDPLTAEEIVRVAGAVRAHATETDLLFSSITLAGPSNAALDAHRQRWSESGTPPPLP